MLRLRYFKIFFLIGFGALVLIQFYQPARNMDEGQVTPLHITEVLDIPVNVRQILQTSCYDCHSNNTNYPWYSYIQPGRILMEYHIKEGKENLNFSEFGSYSKRKQENKLDRISKQIKANDMPLRSYTFIHRDSKLSELDKIEIVNWVDKEMKKKVME
ncbi:MAG: heme-binding domain-containing protein [Algoriphagus sp.]|nr:heme-binding domain-containing protein [Algoriphagus sp.]